MNSLKNTPQQWLVDFLFAFNTGQIEKFNADLERYSNNINNQVRIFLQFFFISNSELPFCFFFQQIIKTNFSLLKEKISILALMELGKTFKNVMTGELIKTKIFFFSSFHQTL